MRKNKKVAKMIALGTMMLTLSTGVNSVMAGTVKGTAYGTFRYSVKQMPQSQAIEATTSVTQKAPVLRVKTQATEKGTGRVFGPMGEQVKHNAKKVQENVVYENAPRHLVVYSTHEAAGKSGQVVTRYIKKTLKVIG